jgi:hypothetical protein
VSPSSTPSSISKSRVLEEVEEEQPPEDLLEPKAEDTAVLFDEDDDIVE